MRGKRSKQYRKLMHQYGLAFNFREPYQVLLSSKIIQDAARCKMRLGAMLENTLHGQIKPMITQCCIRHLYDAQDSLNEEEKQAWIEVAKSAERRRCGHHGLERPLSELDCMKSVVDPKSSGTNKHRYVLATQDVEVRKWMRSMVAGVPMVYIARSVMILEPMGGKSEDVKEREEKSKYRAGLKGRRGGEIAGDKRKRNEDEETDINANVDKIESNMPKRRKVRGPKGPNPLSVKKKKDKPMPLSEQVAGESATERKAGITNMQAPTSNVDVPDAASGGRIAAPEETRKRKRKRKPNDAKRQVNGQIAIETEED